MSSLALTITAVKNFPKQPFSTADNGTMKTSNKSSIITGAVLLAMAALFSISLILQPLDFGTAGPGHDNFFYILGNMLYSVYGFSSILIPAFLLVAGLSCFATKWTARKTMRLLTALIPFFTCVITENICRSIIALGHGSFSALKIIIAIVTGLMLIVIEYLGIGILADKINSGAFKKGTPNPFTKLSKVRVPSTSKKEQSEKDTQNSSENPDDELDIAENTTVFDEALAQVEPSDEEYEDENEEEYSEYNYEEDDDSEELSDDEIEYEEYNAEPEESTPISEPVQSVVEEPEKETSPEQEEEVQPSSSMITQEEFAALTNPVDELEWPNLPPQPESLPPEYNADFDENDPALEFPPKDEPAQEEEIQYEDSPAFEEEPAADNTEAQPAYDPAFDTEFAEEESVEEESPYYEDTPIPSDQPVKEEDPYATTRYIDSVVENPRFPHGIVIHDDNEESEEDEDPDPVVREKPLYPTKIQLGQDTVIESSEEPEVEDDYVEDETLPMPDFDIEEPAINHIHHEETEYQNNLDDEEDDEDDDLETFFNNVDTSSTIPEIEDPYAEKKQPLAEKKEPEVKNETPAIFNQIAQQEAPKPTLTSTASDVFSDMEADIRRSQPKPAPRPAAAPQPSEEESVPEVDFDGNTIEQSNEVTLENQGANNLTADELSDFFNAQQEENTPKTQEITVAPKPLARVAQKKGPYVIPSDLLTAYKDDEYWIIDDATKQAAMNLKQTLAEFNIEAEITGIKKGPVVTMFEMLPAPGVKLSKIVALQDNIALSLAAQSVRIVAPIPGKQAVGIEVPNRHRSVVGFREIIEMDLPDWKKMAVPVVLGKDILGKAQLIDLVKTPHMLIAGATGSGKSVCVNSLILSILFKRSFRDVKMILVDPKVVELKLYNNIPHLLTPVITEPKKALQALKWALCEMERRYALLDQMGVRDISNYNQKIKEQEICTEKLPYIVIIIDEFADLMATSGKELEQVIARLTAMSRAVGIHLVLATQRPSVNVITGLIKANIPTRIAFMVASRTDSNIIIDTVGAEKLLGRGDMLYASAVDPAPVRIQGTFVSDQEVEDVVRTVKEYGEPDYIDDEMFMDDEDEDGARDLFGEPMDDDDPLYDQALEIVVQTGKASASYIQRRLKIGYNRAARIVEEMEERGIVGPANGSKPREVIHIP